MEIHAANAANFPSDIDWFRMVYSSSQEDCIMEKTPIGPQVRPLVFVTGPYSSPTEDEVNRNIQNAIDVGRVLI